MKQKHNTAQAAKNTASKTHSHKNSHSAPEPQIPMPEQWRPTYKWLGILMLAILVFLVIVFFAGNAILGPYMTKAPMELTPWLDSSLPNTSILGI
jgi:hypothetical protein